MQTIKTIIYTMPQRKKITLAVNLILFSAVFVLAYSALAHEFASAQISGETRPTDRPVVDSVRTNIGEKREETRSRLEQARETREEMKESLRGRIENRVQEIKEGARQKRDEMRQKIEEKKEGLKQRLDEKRKEIIKKFWSNMKGRLTAAINRLEKLADKIEDRIAKFEDLTEKQGKERDYSKAKAKLASAREEIELAKATLRETDLAVNELFESADPKEMFTEVRRLAKSIIEHVRLTHIILIEAVTMVRGASANLEEAESPSPGPMDTTSPTTTPTATPTESPTP